MVLPHHALGAWGMQPSNSQRFLLPSPETARCCCQLSPACAAPWSQKRQKSIEGYDSHGWCLELVGREVRCYMTCDLKSPWGKNLSATSGKTGLLSPKCEKHGLYPCTASNGSLRVPSPGWDNDPRFNYKPSQDPWLPG